MMRRSARHRPRASYGEAPPQTWPSDLNNLAQLLQDTNRLDEADR